MEELEEHMRLWDTEDWMSAFVLLRVEIDMDMHSIRGFIHAAQRICPPDVYVQTINVRGYLRMSLYEESNMMECSSHQMDHICEKSSILDPFAFD